MASPAGRVVELGLGDDRAEIPLVTFTKKQLRIVGSRLQSHKFPLVAQIQNSRELPLEGFVDRIYPAERAAEAFDYADKHQGQFRKIVLEF